MSGARRSEEATGDGVSRRTVARGLGAAAVGSMGLLSGCTQGITAALGATLDVASVTAEATDFGYVDVMATVRNTGSREASAILWARVDTDAGNRYEDDRRVAVPGGESETFSISLDVPHAATLSPEDFDAAAWIE